MKPDKSVATSPQRLERRFFHAGDTLWHGHWGQLGKHYGPFDVAFLPINGVLTDAGQGIESGAVMSPEQAVDAALLLAARRVVPIHFGLNDPPYYVETADALERFLRRAEARDLPVRHLKPGDILDPG